MYVTEIFHSIQGEGINAGIPAIFLRLSGCNLRCKWCDTKYSLKRSVSQKTPIKKIIKSIKKLKIKHLVITGGEPLLQQEKLKTLIKNLKNYYIEVETNGTITPKINVNLFNCSPKLKNSGNKISTLKKFPKEKTYYKFIIDKKKDIEEIKKFIKKYNIPQQKVMLMPQAKNKKTLEQKSKLVAEICKKENFRFSPRLHINIGIC